MRRAWGRWAGRLGGPESAALAALLVPAAALWAFLGVADLALSGRSLRIDDRILLALRRPDDLATPIGPRVLVRPVRDVTALGSPAILALVCAGVAGYLLVDRKSRAATFLLTSAVVGLALCLALKGLIDRPRPEVVPHLTHPESSSFPSGHAMLSAVVYLTLALLLARHIGGTHRRLYLVAVAVVVAGLVGASRVYLGVHYPTDVLAGWCVGLAWASLCGAVGRHLERRGWVEKAA